MTGDLRRGIVRDHNVRLDLRWLPETARCRSWQATRCRSSTTSGPARAWSAHVFSLGFEAVY